MDDWLNFNEISLPKKDDFYSPLDIEDVIDADYAHTKEFVKILK